MSNIDVSLIKKHTKPVIRLLNDKLTTHTLIAEGGTRSGKTYGILQSIIIYLLSTDKSLTVDIIRAELATARKTVKYDLEDILTQMELYSSDMHNKSDHKYQINKSVIRLVGANFSDRLKGMKRDIAYINEADQLTKQQFDEIKQRTTKNIILDYNPVFRLDQHWIKQVKNDAHVITSNYEDNPFLTQTIIDQIESYIPVYEEDGEIVADKTLEYNGDGTLIKGDPIQWATQGLGIFKTSPLIIFPHWQSKSFNIPDDPDAYGLDIGYTNPSALVAVYMTNDTIYAKELLYQTELSTGKLTNKVTSLITNKDIPIYSDHSPDVINQISEKGYTIKKAKKSVQDGINAVRSYNIVIHNQSMNLQREITSYRRKSLKNDEPKKENDHLIDALRMAVYTHRFKESSLSDTLEYFQF